MKQRQVNVNAMPDKLTFVYNHRFRPIAHEILSLYFCGNIKGKKHYGKYHSDMKPRCSERNQSNALDVVSLFLSPQANELRTGIGGEEPKRRKPRLLCSARTESKGRQ